MKMPPKNLMKPADILLNKEYIFKDLDEHAHLVLEVYDWLAKNTPDSSQKPEGAEYPYWAFRDLYSVEQSTDSRILQLCIPADKAIFFDMYDWNRILCL